MNTDPDDIFTRALLEPATQALLARLKPQDCDGIPSEVVNASALLDRVCEVLGVPLVDLLRTVEALPRWVPAKDVPVGTVTLNRYTTQRGHCQCDSRFGVLTATDKAMISDYGGFILIGAHLYPPPPKVTR